MGASPVALVGVMILLITAHVAAAQTYPIVDTGQTTFYDNTSEISAPTEGGAFYGQDAQLTGNVPSYTLSPDGLTVYDNVTGLTWTQSPDWDGDGVIDSTDKFLFSDFLDYPDTLNAQSYGGFSDWRAPTIKELYSLILFSGIDPSGYQGTDTSGLTPFLDTDYFAFDYGDTGANERIIDAQYWSSTEYVGTTMGGSATTFGVNFADGRIKGYGRTDPQGGEMDQYALFVRGNTAYGVNDFISNGDGTVTDLATDLMWMQDDSGSGYNWEEALEYCEDLVYASHDDWRLPNAKALQSIVDYTRSPSTTSSPALDPIFTATPITDEGGGTNYPFYWTGTTHASYQNPPGEYGAYVAFGEALGWMEQPPPGSGNYVLQDVHGAGAQRSDPKLGDPNDWPYGHGPQGDVIRIYNYVRCVRDADGAPPASESRLEGRKLLIRDKATDDSRRKIVIVSRDTSIPSPSVDPWNVPVTLTVQNLAETSDFQTFTLPAKEFDGSSGWQWLGNPPGSSGFKYLDRSYTHTACKLVLLKPGRLFRAICKGSQIGNYTLDEDDQQSVGVTLSIGDSDYCMRFEDNPPGTVRVDRSTQERASGVGLFKAVNAPAPTSCPEP